MKHLKKNCEKLSNKIARAVVEGVFDTPQDLLWARKAYHTLQFAAFKKKNYPQKEALV